VCDYKQIKTHIFNRFAPFFKFYRYNFLKTLLKDDRLYPENMLFEDVLAHVKSLLLAKKIAFSKDRGYIYRIREDSTMTGKALNEGVFDALIFIKEVEKFLKQNHFLEELKSEFFNFVCESMIFHFKRCNKDFKKAFSKRAKEYLLKFDESFYTQEKARSLRQSTLNLLNNIKKPTGAALRVKNSLSYKLGKVLLEAKNPLKAFYLPFKLLKIAKDHHFKLKILNTLYAQHPNLKFPALKDYSDYKEALEFKEHLSYKLGEAMIKNPLSFIFKVPRIYKKFKKTKKNL